MKLTEARSGDRGRRLAAAAVAGAAGVFPLAALEWLAGGGAGAGFPVALFAALWLLAGAVALGVGEVARRLRARPGGSLRRPRVWPAAAVALLALGLWTAIVLDQLPCFLGVPNCD